MLKVKVREIWNPYTVGMPRELGSRRRTTAIVSPSMFCFIILELAMRMRRYRVR